MTDRITEYLSSGGLFNPEMANHDAVRDLLIDCREALAASQQEVERLRAELITRAVDALPDGTTLIKTDKLDALRASLALARRALEPFAHFWRQWERQPMSRVGDVVYAIHTGTEYEAELRRSDCERAAEAIAAPSPPPETTQGETR